MSRLQTGALQLVMRDVGLEEVVPAAIAGLSRRPTGSIVDVARDAAARACRRRAARTRRRQRGRQRDRCGRPPTHGVRVEACVAGDRVDAPGRRPRRRASRRRSATDVFQPFQRLGDRSNGTGVGLGLAVARGFVEAMGGELAVEDTPGGGVTMVISLEARDVMTRACSWSTTSRRSCARSASTCAPAATTSTSRPTASTRSTLAARHHPDVVVLDLGLPGIDGVDVIRGLRGWSTVPIIVLSVRDAEPDKVAALDAGADDYVTKPFGMDELLARLRAALRRADAGRGGARRRHARLHHRPRREAGAPRRRRRGAAHADRVAHRRGARPQPGQARGAAAAAAGGVGARVRRRDRLPAGVHGQRPPQARARPGRPRYFITEPGMGYRFESTATT